MNNDQFVWWLHGFFEISKAEELTKEQVKEIKNHLELLFKKVTPSLDLRNPNISLQYPGSLKEMSFCSKIPTSPSTIRFDEEVMRYLDHPASC